MESEIDFGTSVDGFSSSSDFTYSSFYTSHIETRSSVDIDKRLEDIQNFKLIPEDEVKEICLMARDIFIEEDNLLTLTAPITICGDIHGQFHDLLELFRVGGDYKTTKYLFLGDYVDRGYYSVETIIMLLMLKIKYPQNIYLIRGNHECRLITQVYGFYDECMRKYGSSIVWSYCTDLFDYLSLAAVVSDKVFCVHGGLSPNLEIINEIRMIDRKQEVPHDGIMCDLLWSDPDIVDGWNVSPRGAGFQFGENNVIEFIQKNNIEFICRAHQLVQEGYKCHFNNRLITIWSAPNYCYRCGNIASILKLDENLETEFILFDTSSDVEKMHPKRLIPPDYFL